MSEDLEARVHELENIVEDLTETIERQRNAHEAYKEQVVKPRLDELAAARDDAREQRVELKDAVASLRDRVRDLEVGIDAVIGLAEDEQGGPAKRASDLRLGLIRAAEADPDSTTAAKHWQHVKTFFAEHGYGDVSKPLCFRAMDDAADHEGFHTEEDALTLPSGRTGRAIVVDTEKLPNSASVAPSNNATTGRETTPLEITAETTADD